MSWVDLVVALVALAAAYRGWRVGAARQVLSLGGLFLGLMAGAFLTLAVADLVAGTARIVVVAATILGCGALLGALGQWAGVRLLQPIRRLHLRRADQGGGVAIGMLVALLGLWLVGNLAASSPSTSFNDALVRSKVLRTLNDVMPAFPSIMARIESFLSTSGFPIVFVNPPPGLLAPAPLPDDPATAAAVAAARASTVRIVGQACGTIKYGSGFVVGPQLVLTNAHVVAGEASTEVDDVAGAHRAKAVLYDPGLDVAVLSVPRLADLPLTIRRDPVVRGTTAAIVGYPEGGALQGVPAAVTARFNAVGLDVYGSAVVTRDVYQLSGVVEPGDSGGPLVATGQPTGTAGIALGTVIGVVFAGSSSDPQVAYALAMGPVAEAVAAAAAETRPVSTGACLP